MNCLHGASPSNRPESLQVEAPAGVTPAGAVQWFSGSFTNWVGVLLSDAPLLAGGLGPAECPALPFRGA